MTPTIGRVLWYWNDSHQAQAHAALVVFVHSDTLVDLVAFDEHGVAKWRDSVTVVTGDTRLLRYAEWPKVTS